MKEIIEKAINASIEFDAIMDSIDFNSYLPDQEWDDVKGTTGYKTYNCNTNEASDICYKISNENNKKDEQECKLISQLFEAKKIRLKGMQQVEWKKAKERYIESTRLLHSNLDSLPKENVIDVQKENVTFDELNWIRILYYNELAICYSGRKKSSLSLGYAEESKTLLEELFPKLKNFENLKNNELNELLSDLKKEIENPSNIIGLYMFALINWGEAKRTLKDIDSAFKTFQRIVSIYKKCEEIKKSIDLKPNDSFYALYREALILIDQARGKEAIDCLENIKLDPQKDYRAQVCDLEKASALIDQKEYGKAWELLDSYIKLDRYINEEDIDFTFIQRQAGIYKLRLMNEFRKNKPQDFQSTYKLMKFSNWEKLNGLKGIRYDKNHEETQNIIINLILKSEDKDRIIDILTDEADKDTVKKMWGELNPLNKSSEMQGIKDGFTIFENSAKALIKSSWNRKDGDSFKGACTKLAEFYQQENEEIKEKDFEKALKYFHLYLFESKMFPGVPNDIDNIVKSWLENNDLDNLLQAYGDFNPSKELTNNDDGNYLKAFFDVYIDYIDSFIKNENKITLSKRQKETIEKLKERLDFIYQQKDKDSEAEQIATKFERFEEEETIETGNLISQAKKFIKTYYFENQHHGMHIASISTQMKRNTIDFKEKVVGRSKILNENNDETQGTLSVLRRWNSFTPTLCSTINKSKGGGYFLRCSIASKSFGIVIDPGYNFLENFFSQGFKMGDIDLVLVSHAHPDHTDDLPAILSLFHEMNGRLGEYPHQKKANKLNPTLIISAGVFKHYNNIINSKEEEKELKDIIVVDGRDEYKQVYPPKESDVKLVIIDAFVTYHNDLSPFQSLGFIIKINLDDKHKAIIGYTGDMKWRPNKTNPPKYLKYFKYCDIICVHLGSIINILKNKDFCRTFCQNYPKSTKDDNCTKFEICMDSGFKDVDIAKENLIAQTRDENHLYLTGLFMFLNHILQENLQLKVVIISEFGEELKFGIRMDLYKKFNDWIKEKLTEKAKCQPTLAIISKFSKELKNGIKVGLYNKSILFQKRSKRAKRIPICLPGDIGLEVDAFSGNVYCHCCKRFVDRSKIEPVPYGKEEAICFVCNECKAVLSSYQIDHILQEYCENGRKLESMEIDKNGGLL